MKQILGVTERTYKIDELARAAGMSARTVRYYVQRGLLRAPAFRGKDTAYEHEHLVRLRAIRRLQEAYLPLDAIAAELDGRTRGEVERIADGKDLPAAARLEQRPSDDRDEAAVANPEKHRPRPPRRLELFPGVDLTIAEDAPPESVRLVMQMLEFLEAMSKVNEGGRKR